MHDDGSDRASRRERRAHARAERLAQQWAVQVHAELLAAWAAGDDETPVPGRPEAVIEARRRVGLLVECLGPLAEIHGDLLDVPEQADRSSRLTRGWLRNAYPKDDDGTDWLRGLFGF